MLVPSAFGTSRRQRCWSLSVNRALSKAPSSASGPSTVSVPLQWTNSGLAAPRTQRQALRLRGARKLRELLLQHFAHEVVADRLLELVVVRAEQRLRPRVERVPLVVGKEGRALDP